jgi:hypothetical protein
MNRDGPLLDAAVSKRFIRATGETPVLLAATVAAVRGAFHVVVFGQPDGDTLLGVAAIADLGAARRGETMGQVVPITGVILSPHDLAWEVKGLMDRLGVAALPVAEGNEVVGVAERSAVGRLLSADRLWDRCIACGGQIEFSGMDSLSLDLCPKCQPWLQREITDRYGPELPVPSMLFA